MIMKRTWRRFTKEITDGMEIVPVEKFSQVEKIAICKNENEEEYYGN